MLTDSSFEGKVAVVTGAAAGIGQAVALELAANGARVICADRTPSDVTLAAAPEGSVLFAETFDAADSSSVSSLLASVVSQHGAPDIAVNCAGIIDSSRLDDMSDEELDRILSVNLKGTLLFSREALAHMNDSGRLVLLASIAARTGGVKSGPSYAASKGGVLSFARWAAREYAPRQITVNAVAPGPVIPGMISDLGYGPEGIPLGRMGTPRDISQAILFLASEGAAWITGQTLDVNGGLYFN